MSNTLAPYAAQVIGQEFGHGEDKNTAAQLVSHAILGATLAYINGGDPMAGGSAAVASEAAANYLTSQLAEKYKDDPKYFVNGEFQANLLSEAEKAQIRDLTAGIGAVIGGAAGDSSYNAQLAGVIGQNAVENNQAGAHKFAKKQVDQYNNLCAANGVGAVQCSEWTGQRILNNSKELAMIIVPTEIYEVIPVGKGFGIVAKGSKKIIATVKDSKQVQKVLDNITASQVARKSSDFGNHSKKEGKIQEDIGIWPPNSGGYATKPAETLEVGTIVDRYGYPGGSYVSPVGTPFEKWALPSSSLNKPYKQYEVIKPITPTAESKILPWFGQPGQGVQYKLPKSVQDLLNPSNPYLKEIRNDKK